VGFGEASGFGVGLGLGVRVASGARDALVGGGLVGFSGLEVCPKGPQEARQSSAKKAAASRALRVRAGPAEGR